MQPRSPLLRLLFGVCVRLGLGLALLVGLCGMLAGVSLHAHAAPAATLTVTDCSGETGPGRIGTVIGSASALDTITFSCSGTIPITSTLTISKNLTLDGSGQSVTLDGGNSVRVLSVNSGVTFTLNALTIAHGSAGGGGGLADITSTVSISNSTFANNSAGGGGGLSEIASNMSVGGSIVANNSGGNCFGPVLDQGYNLESGTDCGFTGTGDLQNTDPKLDPNGLQNNGGPTQTLALEPDSAAVDQIPTGSSCPATDQRGVSRPQGPACDIGAFEMTAADGVTVMIHVVNSFHLTRSLQTALDNKLQDVLAAINGGQTATACSELSDFIGFVQSHIGKGLTSAQATQLVNEATVIKTRLGC